MNKTEENIKEILERQVNLENLSVSFSLNGKISVKRISFRNPILRASSQASILSNVSNVLNSEKYREERKKIYSLFKQVGKDRKVEEKFKEKIRKIILEVATDALENKLKDGDLPTPISPTSVAISEAPNYYIYNPTETYSINTKNELFRHLTNTFCGRAGNRIYGLYVPKEGFELRQILEDNISDFYNINILKMAGMGMLNSRMIRPFEYLFYLLDRPLREMYRRNTIPNFPIELFVCEGAGSRKKFFSHYVVPGLNEIYYKLYHGKEKYTAKGRSKIKVLISSFIVENWTIEKSKKDNIVEISHNYINRFIYFLFFYKKLDMDSIISLEDLKIRLGDKTPIMFLDEVVKWM